MTRTSKQSLILTAIAFALSAGSATAVPRTASEYVVRNDSGGYVIDYAIDMLKMEKSQQPVKFAGRCDSACTIYLGLNTAQTCITSGAKFGFHLPFGSDRRGNLVAASFMMKKYPQWVHKWLEANGGLSSQLKVMPFAYASKFIKPCKDGSASVQQVSFQPSDR